mgnify:CR=1 FL=1
MDESCLGLTTVVVGHCRYCVNLRLPSLQNNISVAINSLSMMISIVLYVPMRLSSIYRSNVGVGKY